MQGQHPPTHPTSPLGWAVLILLLNPPGVGVRAQYTEGVGLGFEEQCQAQRRGDLWPGRAVPEELFNYWDVGNATSKLVDATLSIFGFAQS